MPQLIVVALIGAGLYAGFRWYARAAKAVATEIKRTEDELRRRAGVPLEKNLGALEYDPASDVYRPADRR